MCGEGVVVEEASVDGEEVGGEGVGEEVGGGGVVERKEVDNSVGAKVFWGRVEFLKEYALTRCDKDAR